MATRSLPLPARSPRPRVVIVGGGMGGIQAAKTLAKAPVEITLLSARNYYLFQPLIYEVANALLQPEDIAHSIRGLLRKYANVHFQLGAATGVDWDRSELLVDSGEPIGFDYLVLATGLETEFHGAPGAAEHTLPLKTLDDALHMRAQTLRRLETVAAQPALIAAGALDVVVVGGGTTGVETAGAFAEIYHHALQEEFRELELCRASIVLLEAGAAILPAFDTGLQQAAQRMLEKRGVEIRLHARVAEVGPASVTLADGEEIPAGMTVWATGVRATPLADSLGLPQARDGRVFVQPNLSLPGHPQAFAIGDMAALPWRGEQLHPPLAQFAIQGGRHAAREIRRQLDGRPSRRFRYLNKGMTASVGRDAAVVQAGPVRFSGRLAFWFWGLLHWTYIPGWRNKIAVDVNWLWSYATHRRAALLLIEDARLPREPLDARLPTGAEHRPRDVRSAHNQLTERDSNRSQEVFAGKLDKSKLSGCEEIAVHAAHASDGDRRDSQAIDDWAAAIARELQQTRPPSGGHFDQQSGPDGTPSRPPQVRDMTAKFTGKYVSLTTFRKDGSAVATPVWFVAEDGHLLVETDGDSYKVKRIRRNDNVTVATCDARGRVVGEPVAAHATVLPEDERPRAERLIAEKYRFDRIFVLPIYLAVQRLRGKPLRYERPVILSITPN